MDEKQKAKLERYTRNSSKFFWGLPRRNQGETYVWLRGKGYEFDKGSYDRVMDQLLQKYGVVRVIEDIVVPRVRELFSEAAVDFLRNCWNAGTLPQIPFLRTYNIENAAPFLEVNSQFDYVERWGELAGPWFEEIEPQLRGQGVGV